MSLVERKRAAVESYPEKEPAAKRIPDYDPRTHRLLVCLNKIRASLAIGGPLYSSGRYKQSKALFTRVINELVSPANSICINANQASILNDALKKSTSATLSDEECKTWVLRTALDCVYDSHVENTIGDNGVYFKPYYHIIREAIDKAMFTSVDKMSTCNLNTMMLKVARDSIDNEDLQLPASVMKSIKEAEGSADKNDNEADLNKVLKTTLCTLYDAIRLPDLNPANRRKDTIDTNDMATKALKQTVSIMDFSRSVLPAMKLVYESYVITDSVMGGTSSASYHEPTEENPYAIFKGVLSSINGGGFASLRFVPEVKETFHSAIDGCTGFIVVMKSLGSNPLKLKMKLSSEKRTRAFNWQSEFEIPCDDFVSIRIDVNSFWPNLFGHVVSDRGSVDFKKVDSVGFIVSRLSEDGTSNQSFCEGDFAFAIKSVGIINGHTSV